MAGSQGAAYSNNAGGKGYVLSKKIRLNRGDKLRAVIGAKPGATSSGTTLILYGGNYSELYYTPVGGTESRVWLAAGGAATAQGGYHANGYNAVNYYHGQPSSSYANQAGVHYHSGSSEHGGGCYTREIWVHVCSEDVGCGWRQTGHYERPGDDTWHMSNEGYDGESTWVAGEPEYHCSGELNVIDHYELGCGYGDGEVYSPYSAHAGSCSIISSGIFANPSASLTQSGNGQFVIKLATQGDVQTVNFKIPAVSNAAYLNHLTTTAATVPNRSVKLNYKGVDARLITVDEWDAAAGAIKDTKTVAYWRSS
ncbi:MAG: hypothetical protein NC548_29460 [Lachnospiraceae bacterium]|nr:hypothetical protein [Lachnospiraceae bacterium]